MLDAKLLRIEVSMVLSSSLSRVSCCLSKFNFLCLYFSTIELLTWSNYNFITDPSHNYPSLNPCLNSIFAISTISESLGRGLGGGLYTGIISVGISFSYSFTFFHIPNPYNVLNFKTSLNISCPRQFILPHVPFFNTDVTQYLVMLCLRYTELTRHLAGPG